ncbi:MAG TPA: hypothetical protein VI007_08645 [bacterium]
MTRCHGRRAAPPTLVRLTAALAGAVLSAGFAAAVLVLPALARVGAPASGFAAGPLMQQLQLTFGGQQAVAGPGARVLHRYVSDDGLITVDLVVRAGTIEQQVMYLPADIRRAYQVSFFLQDALGSIVGSQRGLLSFRASVTNHDVTGYAWGNLSVRFTPMPNSLLQIVVWR